MTVMIGPLILIAAIVSPPAREFYPISGASARASASIRIVSGVSVGPGHAHGVPGAARRSAVLTDRHGSSIPAILLEFQ